MGVTCIWCRKSEPDVSFKKEAHTVPKSLGGKEICKDVCDKCNHKFGSPDKNKIAIEVVLKETFNITRFIVHDMHKEVGKNKPFPRFKSQYFNVNLFTKKITLKQKFKLRKYFQENLCYQFKRGI